jgi:hypothetical protein
VPLLLDKRVPVADGCCAADAWQRQFNLAVVDAITAAAWLASFFPHLPYYICDLGDPSIACLCWWQLWNCLL